MGIFDRWRTKHGMAQNIDAPSVREVAVGASNTSDDAPSMTFNDRNITFSGNISGFDYESILRDKQGNILNLFKLSDYFVDADPIYRGIIKEVYTPFSISDDFRLVGSNERVKRKYMEYYERINLKDKMRHIFLQYYKYGNVYIYLMDDGHIID